MKRTTPNTERVLRELQEGPATLHELSELLPDIPKATINGALHWLIQKGKVQPCEATVDRGARGVRGRLYEVPGWDAGAKAAS